MLPGATVTLTPYGQAQELTIHLGPEDTVPASANRLRAEFAYAEIGWRAAAAAAAVRRDDRQLIRYRVLDPAGVSPPAAFDDYHGGFPPLLATHERRPRTISPSLALRQMRSNLRVFASALPPGSIRNATAVVLPLGNGTDRYAVEIDVTLERAGALRGHYGDALEGLTTGIGEAGGALVDGEAVVITASAGQPVLGGWSSRLGGGTLAFADPAEASSNLSPTSHYPDLTGGPGAATTGVSSPIHMGAPTIVGPPPPGEDHTALEVVAAVLLALAAGTLARLRFRHRPSPGSTPVRAARSREG